MSEWITFHRYWNINTNIGTAGIS